MNASGRYLRLYTGSAVCGDRHGSRGLFNLPYRWDDKTSDHRGSFDPKGALRVRGGVKPTVMIAAEC